MFFLSLRTRCRAFAVAIAIGRPRSCQRMAEGSQQTSAEPLVPHESAINLMAARVGDFAAAIDLMGGTGLQDTPVEGPRTVNWVCRFML